MANDKTPAVIVQGEMLQRIHAAGELVALDAEAISEQILLRILNAGTAQEVLAGVSTVSSDAVLNKPMMVHGVHFNESSMKDGEGVYAVIDARVGSVNFAVTCGSRTVLAQLFRLKELGAYPMRLRITKAVTPTASGFYPLQLEAVPDDAPDVEVDVTDRDVDAEGDPF